MSARNLCITVRPIQAPGHPSSLTDQVKNPQASRVESGVRNAREPQCPDGMKRDVFDPVATVQGDPKYGRRLAGVVTTCKLLECEETQLLLTVQGTLDRVLKRFQIVSNGEVAIKRFALT